jgi:hypothetical protein
MAGGKGGTFSGDLVALILNGAPISGIADNAASSPLTTLYLSLHTADPGAGGAQTTSEAAYGSYARVGVARSSSGVTVSGASAHLTSTMSFPIATGGSETETWFALGTALSGAGKILYRGPLSPTIAVSTGSMPQLATGTTITEG